MFATATLPANSVLSDDIEAVSTLTGSDNLSGDSAGKFENEASHSNGDSCSSTCVLIADGTSSRKNDIVCSSWEWKRTTLQNLASEVPFDDRSAEATR